MNQTQTQTPNQLNAVFQTLIAEMKLRLFEREEPVDIVTLSVLSQTNCFFIGLPGTAKTYMLKLFSEAIQGMKFGWKQFNPHTTPEEIFGPYKLSGLEKDEYERKVKGKLPDRHLFLGDELFKAVEILHSLLEVINEKTYIMDEDKVLHLPLMTFVGASNELPANESLDAIWDRLPAKSIVRFLQDEDNFIDLMTQKVGHQRSTFPPMPQVMTLADLEQAQQEVAQMYLSKDAILKLKDIREQLQVAGLEFSERRWEMGAKLAIAHAWLAGRTEGQVQDLVVYKWVCWNDPEEIPMSNKVISNAVVSHNYLKASQLYDACVDLWEEVDQAPDDDKLQVASKAGSQVRKKLEELKHVKIEMMSNSEDVGEITRWLKDGNKILEKVHNLFGGVGV